jgi:hypothetical protein
MMTVSDKVYPPRKPLAVIKDEDPTEELLKLDAYYQKLIMAER